MYPRIVLNYYFYFLGFLELFVMFFCYFCFYENIFVIFEKFGFWKVVLESFRCFVCNCDCYWFNPSNLPARPPNREGQLSFHMKAIIQNYHLLSIMSFYLSYFQCLNRLSAISIRSTEDCCYVITIFWNKTENKADLQHIKLHNKLHPNMAVKTMKRKPSYSIYFKSACSFCSIEAKHNIFSEYM